MRRRKLFLGIFALITCVVASIGVAVVALLLIQRGTQPSYTTASVALSNTYTSANGSFTFNYPAGWYVKTLDGGAIDLENTSEEKRGQSGDAIRLEISLPSPISQFSITGQGSTPIELIKQTVNAGNLAAALFTSQQNQTSGANAPIIPTPNVPIVTFSVNGRPAAWARQSINSMGSEIANMTIYVDVGHDSIVAILAAPYASGGSALLNRYQDTVLAIANSLQYAPPATATPSSTNVSLSQTFKGTVGGWGMGEITFNYPTDWYSVNFVTAVLQNTQTRLDQQHLQTGQMQAVVVDPASNMALIKDWKDVVSCRANPEGVTALAVVQMQIPSTPEQQDKVAQAGITYSQPESVQINGKDAVLLRIHQAHQDILLIDIDLGNGNIAGLMTFAPEGEMSRYEDRLREVVGTFSYTPKAGCISPTARPAAIQTEIASQITPSPVPTTFFATAVPHEKIALQSTNQKDGWQIFLMDTNGENRQQLTHQKGLYGPVDWSPDGTHLAFILFPSDVFAGLAAYVMKADGSDLQKLADGVESGLSWSPDGQKLALISRKSGSRQIYTVSIDGSNFRPLTAGYSEVYSMSWSPNGQQIIFNRDDYKIYVINADGTGEHQLTYGRGDETPTWSPDGSLIAFSSGRAQNRNLGELFIMKADGSGIRQLTNKLAIPTNSTATLTPDEDWYGMDGIVWSPNGQHIAFYVKKMGDVHAFVIDPDGTNLHHIASNLMGGLSWSPDSLHVTYSAGEMGSVQTFVANADGSGQYVLVNSTPMDVSPLWSPQIR